MSKDIFITQTALTAFSMSELFFCILVFILVPSYQMIENCILVITIERTITKIRDNKLKNQMRNRSASITPTYSTDLEILLTNHPNVRVVPSPAEAREELLKWGISTASAFQRRSNLASNDDWTSFFESCITEHPPYGYDLELLLKKCYAVAYGFGGSPKSPSIITGEKQKNESQRRDIPSLSI